MKVHQGISSDEILSMFGEPKHVDISVCGTVPNQWTCTTWGYGDYIFSSPKFIFSGKREALKLNSFSFERNL